MKLAIDGGAPAIVKAWPTWPPRIDDEQRRLVDEVLDSGRLGATEGPLNERFAAEFARAHDTEHGVMCANGTVALFVALRAAGVKPGDEVIIPTYTFVACATSVVLLGATPVVVDVDPEHMHMTPETIEEGITDRTRAIMVVHIAGSPADMDGILALAERHGLLVIEDSAQAHGAVYKGRKVGGFGHASTFSFQSSKAMTAGEGGIICTNHAPIAEAAWTSCNVGRQRGGAWYGHPHIGWNLRMTELQAAILLPWLSRLDGEIAQRERFFQAFTARLADLGADARACFTPTGTDVNSHHLLLLRLGHDDQASFDRDWIVSALAAEGLPTDLGYPGLATMESVLQGDGRALRTPRFDKVAHRTLWLRQSTMMGDLDQAVAAADATHRVLRDPRSR